MRPRMVFSSNCRKSVHEASVYLSLDEAFIVIMQLPCDQFRRKFSPAIWLAIIATEAYRIPRLP